MNKETMGHGAAAGGQHLSVKRAYKWLWHAWLEAMAEVPLLRWLCAGAFGLLVLAVVLAARNGEAPLEMAIFGLMALLFGLMITAICYLLFEIYRRHRSDAIFDSQRLEHLIRKLAQEEIEAAYDGRGASLGATLPKDHQS